jgi:hypothetical protein
MKIANSGVDSRLFVWIRELIPFRSHAESQGMRAINRGNQSTSGIPQGSVLCPLVFLAYVNDIWRNNESTIRLFAVI